MMKYILLSALSFLLALSSPAQPYPDFSKLNFGCDGNSITSGNQWSATVVGQLGFATHHNVAVGSATWACHADTQDYGSQGFAGISGGWQPTQDAHELHPAEEGQRLMGRYIAKEIRNNYF